MTEKRFTTEIVDWWKTADQIKIVKENGKWIDADDCASLLNALYEENERLHDEIFRLRTMIAYDRTAGDKDE